jgi:hypothetical protein
VIQTRHGLLVEPLLDAGYVVLPVNPDLIARRRGPARKKDDAEDARIPRLLALDRHTRLRPLILHGELAAELRAIARDDERDARAQAPPGQPAAPRPAVHLPGRAGDRWRQPGCPDHAAAAGMLADPRPAR